MQGLEIAMRAYKRFLRKRLYFRRDEADARKFGNKDNRIKATVVSHVIWAGMNDFVDDSVVLVD